MVVCRPRVRIFIRILQVEIPVQALLDSLGKNSLRKILSDDLEVKAQMLWQSLSLNLRRPQPFSSEDNQVKESKLCQ